MELTHLHELVKQQFNQQATNFSNWSVTKNNEYHQAYFDFCRFKPNDRLLDIACGTGDLVLFCAPKIHSAHGVDISEGMIEIANLQATAQHVKNVQFTCQPAENTEYPDDAFSIVLAVPHFIIFTSMIR
ncbi:class I SAM-dependent methyltransferase [candidate division KSB1 bacterium]|nr:class I SAM-dependent methyltransferase [candidate division KSB1 bacterium]